MFGNYVCALAITSSTLSSFVCERGVNHTFEILFSEESSYEGFSDGAFRAHQSGCLSQGTRTAVADRPGQDRRARIFSRRTSRGVVGRVLEHRVVWQNTERMLFDAQTSNN